MYTVIMHELQSLLTAYQHPTSLGLESIGWPTLAGRRCRFKLLLLWKLLYGEGPRRFLPKFHLWWSASSANA